jgi:DNA repair exonuclease SbcCD ATPase subunit
MLKLDSIRLQNFRSFQDATIVFPDRGLLLLRGDNGVGKTSVLLGIAYVLDLLPTGFSIQDMEPWDGLGKPQITLTGHLTDGTKVVWARGRKTSGQVGEDKTSGTKGLAEQQARVFGCGPDILRPLVYRPQGQGGLFLGLEPSAKFEFLTEVLGLKSLLAAIESAEERVSKDLQPKNIGTESNLTTATNQLKSLELQVPAVPPIRPRSTNTDLADAISQTCLAEEALDAILGRLREEQSEARLRLQVKLQSAQDFRTQLLAADNQARAIHTQAEYQLRAAQEAERYRQQDQERNLRIIEDLERQIVAFESQTCPTCEQSWNQSGPKLETVKQARAKLLASVAESQPRTLPDPPPPYLPDPRIKKIDNAINQLNVDLQSVVESLDKHTDIVAAQTLLDKCNQSVRFQEQLLRTRELEEAQYEGKRQSALLFFAGWEKMVVQQKAEVEKLRRELEAVTTELNSEKEFISALGREGFLGRIFEEVLAEIATDANARLQRLANTQSVSLDLTVELVRGRQQVQLGVYVNGHECRYRAGLSGGMQASVEQAIDLAVMEAVGRRVGGLPGWLCWDEAFDGQAGKTRENSLEVLRDFAQDRLVVVVDHHSETKEMFSQVVDIRFENGHSLVS